MQRLGHRIAFVAAALLAACSQAQVKHHVAASAFESGPWVFHPVYSQNTLTAAISIENFVAILDGPAASGDNLVAVWYQRDAGTGNWDAWSWDAADPWQAINSVKTTLALNDDEDVNWATPGSGFGAGSVSPQAFAIGVLASDPLADDIPIAPDPEAFVALLVSSGYQAADLVLQHLDGCKINDKLDGLAAAMYETLVGENATMVSRSTTKWVESGTINCEFALSGVRTINYPPKPYGPPWAPSYECEQSETYDFESESWIITVCRTWVQGQIIQERRTRVVYITDPSPAVIECEQTRFGTRSTTTICCGPYSPFNDCNFQSGPNPPVGGGCGGPFFRAADVRIVDGDWGDWEPPCPF